MTGRGANIVASVAASTARILGPRMMRVVARFNKFVTNPPLRLWAPHLRHMAVIEHRGRTSGRPYRTPVMAFIGDGHLCVVLNYGERSDWVRNVMSAGSAEVVNKETRYLLSSPSIVSTGTGRCVLHAALSPV
jgi:deazaflavin-dependent oxidoreductase (nitroreductase family)